MDNIFNFGKLTSYKLEQFNNRFTKPPLEFNINLEKLLEKYKGINFNLDFSYFEKKTKEFSLDLIETEGFKSCHRFTWISAP